MPDFSLPLSLPFSGNVTQSINPWTFNVNLGTSSNPAVEEQVLSDVASYGKQLGRIGDALLVLVSHFRPDRPLTHAEQKSIADLKRMLDEIADVRRRHTPRNGARA
jgi:hypothetical protein